MGDYKDKKPLNGSIAGEFDIFNIGFNEKVPFEISDDGEIEWTGTYVLSVYNSNKKNTKYADINVGVLSSVLTFDIEPIADGIEVGKHYFEIFNSISSRVEFKGNLEVIK